MDKGTIYFPNMDKGLEVHVDTEFAGNWYKEDSENTDIERLRHGFLISYKGCPIVWKSSLQTEIALSSTEIEMGLLKCISSMVFTEVTLTPSVHYSVYEDTIRAMDMARGYKYHPRTKFLNVKLHRFRYYVDRGEITTHKISIEYQPVNYLTKPLYEQTHFNHRKLVQGW